MKAIAYCFASIFVGIFAAQNYKPQNSTATLVLGNDTINHVKYHVVKDSNSITFVFPDIK